MVTKVLPEVHCADVLAGVYWNIFAGKGGSGGDRAEGSPASRRGLVLRASFTIHNLSLLWTSHVSSTSNIYQCHMFTAYHQRRNRFPVSLKALQEHRPESRRGGEPSGRRRRGTSHGIWKKKSTRHRQIRAMPEKKECSHPPLPAFLFIPRPLTQAIPQARPPPLPPALPPVWTALSSIDFVYSGGGSSHLYYSELFAILSAFSHFQTGSGGWFWNHSFSLSSPFFIYS